MRFVTSYSLEDAWRGRPRIAAMQVIPGENNQGVRLIVNEIAVYRPGTGWPGNHRHRTGPGTASRSSGSRRFCQARNPSCWRTGSRSAVSRISSRCRQPHFRDGGRTGCSRSGCRSASGSRWRRSMSETKSDLRVGTVTAPFNVNRGLRRTRYADFDCPLSNRTSAAPIQSGSARRAPRF